MLKNPFKKNSLLGKYQKLIEWGVSAGMWL